MEHKLLPHDHGQNTEKILSQLPNRDSADEAAEIFKALSDGSRLRILWILCHCSECVTNIAAMVGMSSPAVSHHLRSLVAGGLIVSERQGKEVYYTLAKTQTARLLHDAIDGLFHIQCPGMEQHP